MVGVSPHVTAPFTNIYIFAFVRPDLLLLQLESLAAHIQDQHTIRVVLDNRNHGFAEEFRRICVVRNLDLLIPPNTPSQNGSKNHGEVLNAIYQSLDATDDAVTVFLDHDMFPVRQCSFAELLGSVDVLGLEQERNGIRYLWPGLLMFRRSALGQIPIEFRPGYLGGVHLDTGGGTYPLFDPSFGVKVDTYTVRSLSTFDGRPLPTNQDHDFGFELHLDDTFLHCRNSSGWHAGFDTRNDRRGDLLPAMLAEPDLLK